MRRRDNLLALIKHEVHELIVPAQRPDDVPICVEVDVKPLVHVCGVDEWGKEEAWVVPGVFECFLSVCVCVRCCVSGVERKRVGGNDEGRSGGREQDVHFFKSGPAVGILYILLKACWRRERVVFLIGRKNN